MVNLQRPMLAVAAPTEHLRAMAYPKLASAKIDGVRMFVDRVDGKPVALSRTLKPIPNRQVQMLYAHDRFVGLDGELAVGNPWDKNLMQQTMSGVMSEDGEPDVTWFVFDKWDHDGPYHERARVAKQIAQGIPPDMAVYDAIAWLPQIPVHSFDELATMEQGWLEQGYEGCIIRCPHAPYKQNRSTLKQGFMLKMKRFVDDEAEVIGVVELMHNDNAATTDARGYTKRSSHAENKRASGVLGALRVRGINGQFKGVEFEVGAGFTAEQRENLWKNHQYLIGKLIKFKHFPIGVKDKPRHPVFLGWRDRRDM